MRAILDHTDIGNAAVRSLQAGADLLLVCNTCTLETDAIEAIRQAIEGKELDPARLKASVARIHSVKQRFAYPYAPIDFASIPDIVGISAHQDVLAHIQNHTPTRI
jgi:beta-N-acetylhexosaminidase